MSRTVIVISDLHIGAGSLDDCDKTLEDHLISFIQYLIKRRSPVELVVNGDFLDFAQADPWSGSELESQTADGIPLCFSEEQSLEKLRAITKAHKNIFETLGDLAAAKNCVVSILPGNHDTDFHWKSVRDNFADSLGNQAKSSNNLRFHLTRQYHPENLPGVWIEHGNQYDPVNDFFIPDTSSKPTGRTLYWGNERPPIFKDVLGTERLYECLGTRFLLRVINELDLLYPYIDNIKPFSRMLRLLRDSALDKDVGSRKLGLAFWYFWSFLKDRMGSAEGRSDLLYFTPSAELGVREWLGRAVSELSPRRKKEFTELLLQKGIQLRDTIEVELDNHDKLDEIVRCLAENHEEFQNFLDTVNDTLSVDDASGTLVLSQNLVPIVGFEETKALIKAAKTLNRNGYPKVVFGHTHEKIERAGYINSGCWTRYLMKRHAAPTWNELKVSEGDEFPFDLTFAEFSDAHPTGLLVTFRSLLS